MHLLLAPNAYKGSLSALDAAKAMAEGLRPFGRKVSYTLFPVADGGDGTMELLTRALGGKLVSTKSTNALGLEMVTAFGWKEAGRRAIIGLADVSGLHLIAEGDRNILHANTYGLGLILKAALDLGAKEILLAAGGSATTDGGSGLLRALGLRFLDAEECEITDLPYGLLKLKTIAHQDLDSRLTQVKITVLCDVKNTLLGPGGAAAVFGPQKGATTAEVKILEDALSIWCAKIRDATGVDISVIPFGGAAGGVVAGLTGFTTAKPVSGISYFLDVLKFEDELQKADYVVTGEGALDRQTLEGKGPFEVASRARKKAIPVIGITGVMPEHKDVFTPYFKTIVALSSGDENRETAMKQAKKRLSQAMKEWVEREVDRN